MVEVWELTGKQFESSERVIAVLPVGSVERHGDHLPIGTDAIEALWVASRVAERLKAHLFPPIWYGVSPGLSRFPGTINVDPEAFISYLYSVLREIARNGYRLIVIINGHGGNTSSIRVAMKRAAYDQGVTIVLFDWWRDAGTKVLKELFRSPGHAGEDETSAMLYIDGEHVDMSSAGAHEPGWLPRYYVESPAVDEALYPRAVLGDARSASAEKGKAWLEAVVSDIVEMVEDLITRLGLRRSTTS
ncbi:MAG: creatininase family protein [Acidilobus sp.]